MFHNLSITTSGIVKAEKERIKTLIKKHGGTFTGEMEESKTSLVIILKPIGDKYKFAVQWKIPCVKPEWLYDCDKKGHILELDNYLLSKIDKPKSSTPNKDVSSITANFSMISRIEEPDDVRSKHVDETSSSVSAKDFLTPKLITKNCESINKLMGLSLEDVKKSGRFIHGCKIYLYGFNSKMTDKLKKILSIGGATKLDELTTSVTHVIAGIVDSDLRKYTKYNYVFVTLEWLLKSIELHTLAPVQDYLCFPEHQSPLTKQSLRLLSGSKTTAAKSLFQDDEPPQLEPEPDPEPEPQVQIIEQEPDHPETEQDLLEKYSFKHPEEGFKLLDDLANKSASRLTPNVNKNHHQSRGAETSTVPSQASYVTETNETLFEDLKFYIAQELMEEQRKFVSDLISERGGQIVSKRYNGVPDYAVVPIDGAVLNEMTTKDVVNVYFIVECCRRNALIPISYYHTPVSTVTGCTPLVGCVITVSNYVDTEREFVEQLIIVLGAVCQSALSRRGKDNTFKSTHLVCMEPRGHKYEGALRWGLPIVNHDWLFKCASEGRRVSEEPYLIGDSKLPSTLTTTPRQVPTSVVKTGVLGTADGVTAASKTLDNTRPNPLDEPTTPVLMRTNSKENNPFVSNRVARLRQEATPSNSPEMNRTLTPTSPYGAFYGNDNPSPNTRKRLLRWMNQGAEFPQDPPSKLDTPEKTTPISKVLSRYLESMKRPPEEAPPDDSPVPAKKLNLDTSAMSEENDTITAALKRMKAIEENYAKIPKEQTPVRKSKEFVAAQQYPMVVLE
jgi:topoisomerase (DNA) II binding protein 1